MEDKLQEIPILKKQIELYSNQKQSMKEEIILLIDEKSIEINKNHILQNRIDILEKYIESMKIEQLNA